VVKAMKIVKYRTWVARVPYDQGHFGNHVILALSTDDGLEGIGYISLITPWTIKPLRLTVETDAEQLLGQDPQGDTEIRSATMGNRGFEGLSRSAMSVIDIALWDLKAKAQEQPLYRALGGSRDRVPTYASWALWSNYDLDTLVANAADLVSRGFTAMKFRLGGIDTADAAVQRTRALREAVGDDVHLLADVNGTWSAPQTIAIEKELGQYGLYWLEDPVSEDDVQGLRGLTETLETPVCAGELLYTVPQFRRFLESRAMDILMIDQAIGGFTPWLEVAQLAATYDVPVASHLATELLAHAVAASPNGLTVEYNPWAEPLFTEVPKVENGQLVLSDKPGLGLELDQDALDRFALE
jgi:L-alanine-DL-glutamate epimerase-like enolase superfamily enzyme